MKDKKQAVKREHDAEQDIDDKANDEEGDMDVEYDRGDEEDDGKKTLLDHLLSSAGNDTTLFQ